MSRRYRVEVTGAGEAADVEIAYDNVASVTTIDGNSHGTGPVGNLAEIEEGTRRLIVTSPNALTVMIEPQAR